MGGVLGGGRGPRMGKYRLVRRLAEGGMGEIFIARAEGRAGFEKVVVLKRILQQNVADRDAVAMFMDEARLMAALNHPNIVQVYDFGTAAGGHFFAMEYVHGEDLGRIMKAATLSGRALPLELAIGVIAEAAAGLHHAHEMRGQDGTPLQIVHRDISPSNVLVSYDGAVKLTDFGIAKWNKRQTETRHGGLKGKIAYMSPEQCRAGPLDRRSDVFGLGILLFELTTGTRLYQGTSDFGILEQIVHHDAPRPSTRRPGYPPAVERIVMRALSRAPEGRHQTARELQLELEAFALEARLQISGVARAAEMQELFGRKIEAWREAVQAGHSLEDHLAAADGHVPLDRTGRTVTRPEAGASQFESTEAVGSEAPHSRRPLLLGLGLLAAATAGGVLWWRRPAPTPPREATTPPVPPATAHVEPATPPPIERRAPASAPSTAATRAHAGGPRARRRGAAPAAPSKPVPAENDKKKIWNPDSIYLP
jgi:tRNA A-37 threonylcarbamoyl transferase component Bud32